MYEYIKGLVTEKKNDYIVIENNGIGFKLFCPLSTISSLQENIKDTKVYTHLYVREDNMSLFGFATTEEKFMFELLLTVSGVGPKASISMVSSISPSKFSLCVITGDAKTLTKAQGIGLKTAQRIILELKDKLKKENISEDMILDSQDEVGGSMKGNKEEAVGALLVLGYTYQEALKAVIKAYSDDKSLEDIVKDALKLMMR